MTMQTLSVNLKLQCKLLCCRMLWTVASVQHWQRWRLNHLVCVATMNCWDKKLANIKKTVLGDQGKGDSRLQLLVAMTIKIVSVTMTTEALHASTP